VLAELDLAQLVPRPELEQSKTKDKEKVKFKDPNQFKDKESGERYIVGNRPSVIISITGDAADLPEDEHLARGVEDFLEFCKREQGLHACFKLSREDAYSAFLSNNMCRDNEINEEVLKFSGAQSDADYVNKYKSGSKCLQISLLLQKRVIELNSSFKDKNSEHFKNFEYHFRFPSVRDMLLNVKASIDKQLDSLKDPQTFKFPPKNKQSERFYIKDIQISGANEISPSSSGFTNQPSISAPARSVDIKQPGKGEFIGSLRRVVVFAWSSHLLSALLL
jgi:hypothetical protein